jgi:hypothetical protein
MRALGSREQRRERRQQQRGHLNEVSALCLEQALRRQVRQHEDGARCDTRCVSQERPRPANTPAPVPRLTVTAP